MEPGARLRGDVCTNFAAVRVRHGPRWGYVTGGDAGGLWEVTSRDDSSISGFCPGRFELSRGHGLWKPGFARTSFGLRSASGHF